MKRIFLIATIALLASMTVMASDKGPRRPMIPQPPRPLVLKMPEALKAGDKIAIISPASTPGDQNPEKAAATLRAWGFEPVIGQHVLTKYHT